MIVLGIHDGHDSGAAIIKNGHIVSAVNEERLNRQKLTHGFPRQSILKVLELANITPDDVDFISIATKCARFVSIPKPYDPATLFGSSHGIISTLSVPFGGFLKTQTWKNLQKNVEYNISKNRRKEIPKLLRTKYGFDCPIKFLDHHLCHAASAYYTSGKKEALIITADASGDALSTTVSVAKEGNIKRVLELSSYNSIASYYSYVTQICGYKPSKHEGKITGLAAHGTPKYFNVFQKMIKYENGRIVNRSNSRHDMTLQKIKKRIKNYSKEDLAASVQCHLEENISKFISYWVHKTKISDVIVAGGIFANVKLNQRIAEIPTVESFFAHPHMGDGGIGVGAALYISMQEQLDKGSFKPYKLQNVYFGPEFSNAKIEEAITISGLKGENIKNIEKYVAEKIAQKKIVGHFNGRMEYGPRALGNRSILADPTDTTINDWLNKRLHRTEFMPFAPSILDTGAPNYYKKYEKSAYPAQFMTITFDTTKKALKAKAVVHIDHTTRPQVVSKEQNPRYYKILQLHKQITGLPLFVNTSFNIHEEPIVCTPADAIKSFNQGCVDVLVMGNWVIEK